MCGAYTGEFEEKEIMMQVTMHSEHENNYKSVYKFRNGYGASVVCNPTTYGYDTDLFEVAVLDKDGRLCYDTPITDDVVGYLNFQGVADILKDISELEPCV